MASFKPISISSNESISASRETINKNFKEIASIINALSPQGESLIRFPDSPIPNEPYVLSYVNGSFVATQASLSGLGGSGSIYWLLPNETLIIPARRQHIVYGNFIQDEGSNLIVEPTGQLIIL